MSNNSDIFVCASSSLIFWDFGFWVWVFSFSLMVCCWISSDSDVPMVFNLL